MLPAGTPADWMLLMISRTISGDEQQAGAPLQGINLDADDVRRLETGGRVICSPVNSFIPRSIMSRTTRCGKPIAHDGLRIGDFHHPSGNNPAGPAEIRRLRSTDDFDRGRTWQGHVAEGFGIDAIGNRLALPTATGLDERSPIHGAALSA